MIFRGRATALLLIGILPATLRCAHGPPVRTRRPAVEAEAQTAAARYRGWLVIGDHRKVPFRAQVYASRPDRLRIEVLSPLGQPKLSLVSRNGSAVALIPGERVFWRGETKDEGGSDVGLLEGTKFWVLTMIGGENLVRSYPDGSRLEIRYEPAREGAGGPPSTIAAEVHREGAVASLRLERASILAPLEGDEPYHLEIPDGFEELVDFDLLDMIASRGGG